MEMKQSEYEILTALSQGEWVSGSRFRKDLLQSLKDEQLLTARQHGSRISYRATDPQEIGRIYRLVDPSSLSTRAELVEAFGDSKLRTIRSCPGFPVNVYQPLSVELGPPDGNGRRPRILLGPVSGAFTFVSDWQNFRIPGDVLVVGVENMENFRKVENQRHLFSRFEMPILFVSRYPQSGDLVAWLKSIPNRYLHFGDFDLAGINIFLTEFRLPIDGSTGSGGRTEFYVPEDIESLLARGSAERYHTQIERFGTLSTGDPQLQRLISLIHKHRRGYDQEGLIGNNLWK